MPNPTIDLQRDCELFVDFDSDYFDSQRNKILDRSGNGRHPEASGGPTLGGNGPDNFEAASFDGSDDFFDSNTTANANEQTVMALVSLDAKNAQRSPIIAGDEGTFSTGFGLRQDDSDNISYFIFDGGGSFIEIATPDYNVNEFVFAVGVFDGSEIRLIIDGDVKDSEPVTSYRQASRSTKIGTNGTTSSFLSGDIAFTARWSRVLNDAEIEYLNRLTEPRRAQL
jgi:hypothetical protein